MVRVRVETPCFPTEDPAKVKRALLALFPDLTILQEDDRIVGTTSSLAHLRDLIRTQRIRDTARARFLGGRDGRRTHVSLSKQAAFMGRVNFATPSGLGAIEVEIQDDDLAAVIDDVAESTVEPRVRSSDRTEGT